MAVIDEILSREISEKEKSVLVAVHIAMTIKKADRLKIVESFMEYLDSKEHPKDFDKMAHEADLICYGCQTLQKIVKNDLCAECLELNKKPN